MMAVATCEMCGQVGKVVVNDAARNGFIYRRRACSCGNRWSTWEVRLDPDTQSLLVVPKQLFKILQTQMLAFLETLEQVVKRDG